MSTYPMDHTAKKLINEQIRTEWDQWDLETAWTGGCGLSSYSPCLPLQASVLPTMALGHCDPKVRGGSWPEDRGVRLEIRGSYFRIWKPQKFC